MPAKKAASKKRKKVTASKKKKVVARKSAAKRKVAKKKARVKKKAPANKRPAAKKKPAARKKSVSKKKPAARKKAISKKKPAAKKKVASKKKAVSKKKAPVKKPVARKAAATARKPAPRPAPPRRRPRSRGDALSGPIHGIAPYKVSRGEEYMGDEQLRHFRKILGAWKKELMFEVDRTVHHMQDEAANFPDPNDRATQESEFGLELRTRDRERKLLRKIDSALRRVDDGSYGFCDETGEEIGLKRLEARPVATLSLEAQERREIAERQFRDRDDQYR